MDSFGLGNFAEFIFGIKAEKMKLLLILFLLRLATAEWNSNDKILRAEKLLFEDEHWENITKAFQRPKTWAHIVDQDFHKKMKNVMANEYAKRLGVLKKYDNMHVSPDFRVSYTRK